MPSRAQGLTWQGEVGALARQFFLDVKQVKDLVEGAP